MATLADLVVLSVLVHAAHASPRLASPIALTVGVLVQFVGNKLVAFEDSSAGWLRQAGLFGAVESGAFLANLVLFDVAVRILPLPPAATRLLTTSAVYGAFCLPLWSRIFHEGSRPGGSRSLEVPP